MELTLSQIQSLTVGAVSVFQDAAGYRFRRFTQRQIDVIFENDPTEPNYDTTGIRIDFHTDATQLLVSVASSAKYEVLINDRSVYCETLSAPAQFFVPLADGDNRITIVLPSHSEGILQSIALEDASYVSKHTYPIKLVFYGDSITQGWNSEKPSQSYVSLTSRYFDADSRNYGIGGTTFIPDFPEDTGYFPDAVLVALGTNDYGRNKPMEQIQKDCTEYLVRVKSVHPSSKLFCITPIWRWVGTRVKAAGTLDDVRHEIARIAQAQGFTVIDGTSMVLHHFAYYSDKGTHPNPLGFAHYAQNLIRFLAPYL